MPTQGITWTNYTKPPQQIVAEAQVAPLHPSVDMKDPTADMQLDALIAAGGEDGENAQIIADYMFENGLTFGADFGDPVIRVPIYYAIND